MPPDEITFIIALLKILAVVAAVGAGVLFVVLAKAWRQHRRENPLCGEVHYPVPPIDAGPLLARMKHLRADHAAAIPVASRQMDRRSGLVARAREALRSLAFFRRHVKETVSESTEGGLFH